MFSKTNLIIWVQLHLDKILLMSVFSSCCNYIREIVFCRQVAADQQETVDLSMVRILPIQISNIQIL